MKLILNKLLKIVKSAKDRREEQKPTKLKLV